MSRAWRIALACTLAFWVCCPQVSAQQPVPAKIEDGYRIGPYPVKIEYEGVEGILYSWLYFTPIVEGRANPSYRLRLTLKVQFDGVAHMFRTVILRKYPQDNCARINNIDNWVYSPEQPRITVVNANTLQLDGSMLVSTWSCFENPVFETVCDHYKDSLGIEWPYNCHTRRGSPIKTQNVRQGVDVTKRFWLDARDGVILYKDYTPTIHFAGGPADTIVNFVATIEHNIGATFANAFMSPSKIEMMVPQDYRAFRPTYDIARFETNGGAPFIVVGASAGVTTEQINAFMRRTFGELWTDIAVAAKPAEVALTKAEIRRQCDEYMPGADIRECAAKMGLPYDELPD